MHEGEAYNWVLGLTLCNLGSCWMMSDDEVNIVIRLVGEQVVLG